MDDGLWFRLGARFPRRLRFGHGSDPFAGIIAPIRGKCEADLGSPATGGARTPINCREITNAFLTAFTWPVRSGAATASAGGRHAKGFAVLSHHFSYLSHWVLLRY